MNLLRLSRACRRLRELRNAIKFSRWTKNKWSIFFELGFHSKYEANKKVFTGENSFGYEKTWSISYNCLDLGLGFRHYMFLNNNSKLFLNISGMYSPTLEANLQSDHNDELKLRSKPYLGLM